LSQSGGVTLTSDDVIFAYFWHVFYMIVTTKVKIWVKIWATFGYPVRINRLSNPNQPVIQSKSTGYPIRINFKFSERL